MLAASENYKGIKFIRISSLPSEQRNQIWKSLNPDIVIKILKGETLLADCVQYKHYLSWYENIFNSKSGRERNPEGHHDLAIAS
jgi:hypothetical protein